MSTQTASEQLTARPALENSDPLANEQSIEDRDKIVQLCSELLRDVRAQRVELPTIPKIAVRIGRAVKNPDATNNDIARIIARDPSLTARLIKIVNSPAFASRSRIDNCPDAVARLGRETTGNLVVSLVLKNMFYSQSRVLQKKMHDLWRRCSRVAAICQVLAQMTPGLLPDRAMLAGLVHEIGMISILRRLEGHPHLANNTLFQITPIRACQAQIGATILQQWGFADECIQATLHADDWTRTGVESADYTDLVIVARLHAAFGSPEARSMPGINQVPAFHKLALGGLDPSLSIQVLVEAEKEIRSVQRLLGG